MNAKTGFNRCWQWKVQGCTALVGILSIAVSQGTLAQIVPDGTLGRDRSVVTPNVTIKGIESDRIDGGAIRGANLFHSFEQFNVDAGRGAYFANPVEVQNILSRVTGANRSEILGRLGVLGNANLFLINPRGIVFGPDSSLDVQGSFFATTADAIRLEDTGLFSASQPTTSNLLSVSPSAFWFNAVAASPIVNRSRGAGSISQPNSVGLAPGLQIQPDRTLALIGGDVLLEQGNLTAAGGRIELGSVAGVGEVSLTQSGNRFVLGYDSIGNFGTVASQFPLGVIALSNGAFVDASGEGGGEIQVRGARLDLVQGSNLRAETLGTQNGGEILIRTAETSLSEESFLSVDVANTGTGTGGNLTLNTGRLSVRDGSQVSANTFGIGKGGRLQITASDSIEVIGQSADGQLASGLLATSEGSGDGGNLSIDTGRLIVKDGAEVAAITAGTGKGGNLQITASDSIELIGVSANSPFASGLYAQSQGSGDAGDLRINTGRLIARDGGQVVAGSTSTGKGSNLQITASDSIELVGVPANSPFGSGLYTSTENSVDAGDLTIDTRRLIVRDGAQVAVGTLGAGNGGNLQITASDSIELSGTIAGGRFSSGLFAQSQGSGNAGNLNIDTGRLRLRDGGVISSASLREGTAGNINITARNVLQSDGGKIITRTRRSAGGAITIESRSIQLFGDTDIRSDVASGANNGGAITLTAGSILAFDNSDILAFARDGSGGNITLNTPAFFGENYRPAPGGTNPDTFDLNNRVDINATGVVSGIITLPDVSFIQNSLVELPENQINTDTLLANSCIVRSAQPTRGSFTITGTGGFAQRPGDVPISGFPTVDVETLPDSKPSSVDRTWRKGDPIVEPQGVYRLPSGKLVLSRNCH